MTRVLVIEPAGNLWGSERALLDLLDYSPELEVAVCLPPGRLLNAELERRGILMLPYYIYALHEKTKLHRLWAAFGVLLACLKFKPDVIYLNQSGAYKVVLPAAFLLRLPMVAHIRIFEDVAYIARQRPNSKILRGVVAISAAISDEIQNFGALAAIPCHQIFDSYAVRGRRSSGNGTKRQANRIACVGRVVPIKGQDVLVAALPLIPLADPPVECLIAGDTEDAFAKELKRRTSEIAGVTIRWLGLVQDVEALLECCAVMVAPSYREALGRVIFEAWEAGAIPVVFAGSGGAAEIIAAADGGILYVEQTPRALAAALVDALALDQAERIRLTTNGRSWMAKNCDPRRYGRKISAILSGAAQS